MLNNLQSDFASYLLHGDDAVLTRVASTAKVDARTRLAIYFDAYRLRLLEALDSNFPVLHAWMGDEAFTALGLAYIAEHPSAHFSIRYFGHRLPAFLTASEPYRAQTFLSEMAVLEWAMTEAFDAEDTTVLILEDMAAIPPDAWPDMRLLLHPSVHQLGLHWNVPIVWKAMNKKTSRADPDSLTAEKPPIPLRNEHPHTWLIWRQNLKTYFRSAPVNEAWALDAARAGTNFAGICAGLCEWIDEQHVAANAAGLLKQWVIDGMIQNIDF